MTTLKAIGIVISQEFHCGVTQMTKYITTYEVMFTNI